MSKLQNETYLIKILDLMRDDIEQNQKSEFFHKFYDLKEQNYVDVSPEVVRLYKNILKGAIRSYENDRTTNSLLTASISLCHNLIPTQAFDHELDALLQKCVSLDDSRTKANALTALGEYNPESELFKDHFESKSNRVAADAIIVEGKKKVSREVLNKIDSFLKSSNPYFVSSGIFIVSSLYDYHYTLRAQEAYETLEIFNQKLMKFVNHPHEMVRKRAHHAIHQLQKVGRAA